ncbi:sulfotransferase [Neobacillus sp. WH10]|uniref:sulfotransferase n=1 Tax=Neobacillus sp. WH10 TaxID=3047873 RepID=UPI0024C17465|nr:sulfotransferase [Neobacillus sp. WH10]WHY78260.1 sulfotransferase [Neobacillus sp. WH10]
MTDFKKDVIMTGIPRGGTTLSAALLDSLKNAVCLSEPRWQSKWFKNIKDVNRVTECVMNDYKNIRRRIIENKPIMDTRNEDGTPLTNYYSKRRYGRRVSVRKHGAFTFEIENENFLLGMKHNEHYTGILPQLLETDVFSIIAIVRHPVPTILSWKSLNLYISNGRMPYAEPFWKELREITCSSDKSLLTFVKIYDLFCQRYLSFSNEIHLLKYEDIIKNPQVFEELTGLTYKNKVELSNRNQSKNYNFALADDIKNLITIHAPNALKLYQMDEESIS